MRGGGGPNLGSEEESVRVAMVFLLVLAAFVVSLMSGIDTLHGATADTPDVDVGALSIFTGTLETGALCSRWTGYLLSREMFAKPSLRG